MSTEQTYTSSVKETAINRIVQASVIATLIASIINLLIFFLVPTLFNFVLEIPLMGPGSEIQQLPFVMVIVATVLASIGATLLLLALNHYTARPLNIFRVIAIVFLLISFGAPFGLPVASSIQLTLASMHIVAAVIITYMLTIWVQAQNK